MSPPRKYEVKPGERFGRLMVLAETRMTQGTRTRRAAKCQCDCGKIVILQLSNLVGRRKPSRSCGCGVIEATRSRSTKHGLAAKSVNRHPLYNTWHSMIYRCESPKSPSYSWYGAKGVRVDASWKDPAVFIEYIERVLGPRPDEHTLDRVDPSGNYEPGNVRWADASTQTLNRRRS